MNHLLHAIYNLKKMIPKESPKILGRWNIDYCSKKINNKIDLSNEDHCGPCGQYALSKMIDNVYTQKNIECEKNQK